MSAGNTISIRLEVQGTPQVLSQLKSVLTGVNGLQTGLNQAKGSLSGGFRLDGLQGLTSAIGTAETKVSTFKATLSKIGSTLASNGAAFGVATASIWGVYNAYDSLVKVEIRAHQAQTRVMTTTTSLAAMEERLRQARESGNLTAEEMAILEEKITNTKARLAVAQERSADLQGDVNEAWAAFASQVAPQVIAASGSIAQLISNLRGSFTGVIPRIKEFIGGLTQMRTSSTVAASGTFQLSGAVASAGPAGAIGAGGVRLFSGALKGLLIGTGIGLAIVGIGLLIEAFTNVSEASQATGDNIGADVDATTGEVKKYSDGFQAALDRISGALTAHAEEVRKTTEMVTSTIRDADLQMLINSTKITEARYKDIKAQTVAAKQLLDDLKKGSNNFDFVGAVFKGPAIAEAEKNLGKLEIQLQGVTTQFKNEGATLKEVNDAHIAQNKALVDTYKAQKDTAAGSKENAAAFEKTFQAVKRNVDLFVRDFIPAIKNGELSEASFRATFEESSSSYSSNSDLKAVATERFNERVKELFPDLEKAAKEEEKVTNKTQELLDKLHEAEKTFGVDIPDSLITTDDQLQQFTDTLEKNKDMIDEWHSHAAEFTNVATAAKAFKIEFKMDKEIKDFIKDLPKETEKKVKIVMKREQGVADFKAFFTEIQGLFFRQFETKGANGELIMTMGFRPIYNPKDAIEIRDQILDQLESMFGENAEKGGVWAQKLYAALNNADSQAEIIKALQDSGLLIENKMTEIATKTAAAFNGTMADAMANDPFNILGGKNPEGVTTFDKNGKAINTPAGSGASDSQIKDQSNLQVALQKTQTALANLSNEGIKSLTALAKASSTLMNGMKNNLNVGYVSAGHFQVGLANLANQGTASLQVLAKASSTQINGMRNNLNVGYVSAGHFQVGLANLANQGAKSLAALAHASSVNMNGFVANLKKGETAVKNLQKAINSLKDKTVYIGLTGPGVKFLASGFHGIVDKPTIMVVGEAGAERVDVSPVVGGHDSNSRTGLTTDRNVRIEPVGKLDASSMKRTEIVDSRSGGGASHVTLISNTYLYPNSEAYKKSVQEFSLDDISRYSSS